MPHLNQVIIVGQYQIWSSLNILEQLKITHNSINKDNYIKIMIKNKYIKPIIIYLIIISILIKNKVLILKQINGNKIQTIFIKIFNQIKKYQKQIIKI